MMTHPDRRAAPGQRRERPRDIARRERDDALAADLLGVVQRIRQAQLSETLEVIGRPCPVCAARRRTGAA